MLTLQAAFLGCLALATTGLPAMASEVVAQETVTAVDYQNGFIARHFGYYLAGEDLHSCALRMTPIAYDTEIFYTSNGRERRFPGIVAFNAYVRKSGGGIATLRFKQCRLKTTVQQVDTLDAAGHTIAIKHAKKELLELVD